MPLRCPRARGKWRSRAHLPLPSMMMATWRGTAPLRRILARSSSEVIPRSHLHDLRLFGFQQLVDLVDVVVMQLLQILLSVFLVVFRRLLDLFDRLTPVGSRMTDGDAPFFRELVDDLHEVATTFLVERWQRHANDIARRRRIQPELGIPNGLFDRVSQ